jgi:undecaprenyl-diphosphatase
MSSAGPRLDRRLARGFLLLLVAFALDPYAFDLLRTATLVAVWEDYGEIREGLLAAKFLASGLGTAALAAAVAALGPRGVRRAAVLVLVVVAVGACAGLVKVAAGRDRPASDLEAATASFLPHFAGPAAGSRTARSQSFPSGHTAAAWASATTLAAFAPRAAPIVYTVAALAGVQRVVVCQHFLSDVVGGALLGHVLASWLLRRRRIARLWRGAFPGPPPPAVHSGG